MNDLSAVLGLDWILEKHGLGAGISFEQVYSRLSQLNSVTGELEYVNSQIREYFEGIVLPPAPNLYDHLVLSLTSKDLIATFNWDPLLYNAWVRNRAAGNPPRIAYLHGNVAIGYCEDHRVMGVNGGTCKTCGRAYTPSNLLYPVEKTYTSDPFLKTQWRDLQRYLSGAFMLTIFGYSAPQSDVEAITMMKAAWGSPDQRVMEEIEIIDIKDDAEIRQTWAPFIHTHHYRTCRRFYDSVLASFPTRSCEMMWEEIAEAKYLKYQNRIPLDASLEDLHRWRGSIQASSFF